METIRNEHLSAYLGINAGEYFLTMEKISLEMLADEMHADGVIPDFTLLSISPVVKWMLGRIERLHQANIGFDDCEFNSHINCEIDNLILHASYYLGESFVNSVNSLSWETDARNHENQASPLVAGFKFGLKTCPIGDINSLHKEAMLGNEVDIGKCIDEIVIQWLMKIK